MPRPRTGNPVGRPFTYTTDEERPTTVSLRIPHDLYAQAKRYVRMRSPMTLTELLLDGLRLRLATPVDPRDMILSDDNTVIQELQGMIRAAVQAEVEKLSDFMDTSRRILAPEAPAQPVAEVLHDENTVIQERATPAHGQDGPSTPAPSTSGISYDNNTVIHQPDVLSVSAVPDEADGLASRSALDKATITARLRRMRDTGMSLQQIATQLTSEGVQTLSGRGQWQKGSIDKLLRTA